VILCLQPLIGAIAAGCPAVVKPSEIAPHIAQVLADLFPKYLDPTAYTVVNGAVPETTALLEVRNSTIFLMFMVFMFPSYLGAIFSTQAMVKSAALSLKRLPSILPL
jgi:hypothetical protein